MICGTLESGKSSRMLMPIGKYKVMVEIQQRITITLYFPIGISIRDDLPDSNVPHIIIIH
ncbi:MAG: hypothetical protein LE180_05445 [Endomicrobium sp.]|uniref:hypothetical protein n=1 Tax=Candidatus Endomicrobiellum pyrsonymphae TaxID=1408203 RepID=UPI003583EAB0|nr:hypothetical protein [Endomicrobium sp.]